MTSGRRTILLTGASGVLGRALLMRLRGHRVIGLGHRTPVASDCGAELVRGDVRLPLMGLPSSTFESLAAEVDAVVHAAAGTNFSDDIDAITKANLTGTRRVLEFAQAADASIYHVSTALLHGSVPSGGRRTPLGRGFPAYRASKAAAEELVLRSEVPHAVLRPSLIGGDSRTGEIARFQGVHALFGYLLDGDIPITPLPPDTPVDYIPQDLVADAIARLIECSITGGVYWLTTGPAALTLSELVDVSWEFACELGREIKKPRFVATDIVDRLLRPVFMDAFPYRVRSRIERILEFTEFVAPDGRHFPTSLPWFQAELGMAPLPDLREALRRGMEFWAEQKGLVQRAAA